MSKQSKDSRSGLFIAFFFSLLIGSGHAAVLEVVQFPWVPFSYLCNLVFFPVIPLGARPFLLLSMINNAITSVSP